MPAGRPSTYDKKYCEQVVELGKQGMSPVEIACEIGVPRTTMLSWADKHEEFSTALTRAKEWEQVWWERKGREGMVSNCFNAQVWKTSMQARFREDYTERKELTIDGNLGDRFARAEERLKDAGS
jgi:hypothetical protein